MFKENICKITKENGNYRREIITGKNSQVVVMNLQPKEEIGMETHEGDQILFVVEGTAGVVINGESSSVGQNEVVFVPSGLEHNVINSGDSELKLFTIYAPPEHRPGIVQELKEK